MLEPYSNKAISMPYSATNGTQALPDEPANRMGHDHEYAIKLTAMLGSHATRLHVDDPTRTIPIDIPMVRAAFSAATKWMSVRREECRSPRHEPMESNCANSAENVF